MLYDKKWLKDELPTGAWQGIIIISLILFAKGDGFYYN
jgi:hypothetical protein